MARSKETEIALMAQDIQYIKEELKKMSTNIISLQTKLENDYVEKKDVAFIWRILYALVAAVITTMVSYFFSLFVLK